MTAEAEGHARGFVAAHGLAVNVRGRITSPETLFSNMQFVNFSG